MTEQLVHALMDAQAANAAQDRALWNPSPEVDSAVEHAVVLLRTATEIQYPHVIALIELLGEIQAANTVEREHERHAAGIADPVTSVHEFARMARPLLADLANPIFPQRLKAERLGDLHKLFGRTVERTLRAFSLRPLLGVNKYTNLVERLVEWDELRALECGR